MERLTQEAQIGSFASLKDKAVAKPRAFNDYDCFLAHARAVTALKAYEDICFDNDGKERITVEELSALVKARDEGRMAIWPAELWDVKPNPMSNEWNDEPEYHLVHYIVHAFEPETGRYFVNTDNYSGLKHRHWVHGKRLHKTRAEAEAVIGGGGDG